MSEMTQGQAVEMMQHLLVVGSSTAPFTNTRAVIAPHVQFKDAPATVMLKDDKLLVHWPSTHVHEVGQQVNQLLSDVRISAMYEFSRHLLTVPLTADNLQKLHALGKTLKPAVADVSLEDLTHENRIVPELNGPKI